MASKDVSRKKAEVTSSQSSKITDFFRTVTGSPSSIVGPIIEDLISHVVLSHSETISRSTDEELVESTDRPAKGKKKRRIGEKLGKTTLAQWKAQYPWLLVISTTDTGDMKLSCATCTKEKISLQLSSVWCSEGTVNIQKNSISQHIDSTEHQKACEAQMQQTLLEKASTSNIAEQKADSDHEYCPSVAQEDSILFNTIYFLAKADISSANVNGMLDLQKANGVCTKYQNLSWDTITSIQKCISKALKNEVVTDIKNSEYFGMMLGECTDITNEKRLSICVRYVKDAEPVTKFLCNVPISDGHAHTIVAAVHAEFEHLQIDMTKCVSVATDGALAMTGKHMGAGKQLQRKYSPFCTQTHCIAHRLNLACNDTIKENSGMAKFDNFMNASSVRRLTLKQIQTVF